MSWWADKLAAATGAAPMREQDPFLRMDRATDRQQQIPDEPRCPECGSGDYQGTNNTKPRCFDCGYPLTQSGTGLGGKSTRVQGVKQARQVESNGYHPTQIVGRI